MSDLIEFKQKRKIAKGKLTRLNNFISNLDENNIDESELNNLQTRLDKIEPVLEEYEEIQTNIELIEPSDTDDNDRRDFENTYFTLIGRIKCLLNTNARGSVAMQDTGSNASASSSHSGRHTRPGSSVKLPPIKLPVFDGEYANWLDFKEMFKALVDRDESLNKIQKFYYLRNSLTDSVKDRIKSIELTEENYEVVWNILNERYESKQLTVYNHINAIFESPKLEKESSVGLRDLHDNVTKHLRALKSLGEYVEHWDRLIIYIIANKFDPTTKRDWETYTPEGELATLKDLEKFLKFKCQVLEKLTMNNANLAVEKKKNFNQGKLRTSSSYVATQESNNRLSCYYCNGGHTIFKCSDFLRFEPEKRMSEVKRLKLCLNCFKPTHTAWQCKMSRCFKCHKPHNTLLHDRNYEAQNISATVGANIANPTLRSISGETNVASGAEERHVVQEKGQETISLLNSDKIYDNNKFMYVESHAQRVLATAIVFVKSGENKWVKCRALLDGASQSNIMTCNLSNKLMLKCSETTHVLRGIGNASTLINDQANITIKSQYGNFTKDLRCLVLPKITENLPTYSFDKNLIQIPKYVKSLADPEFNISSEIDLLLGSEIFWISLLTGKISLGKNGPVLQNTVFGYVLGGNLQIGSPWNIGNNMSTTCLVRNHLNNTKDECNDALVRFWNIEEVTTDKSNLSIEEKICEEHFKKTTTRDDLGRFVVDLPFNEQLVNLGNSYDNALHRFQLLEKRLGKNPQLKRQYCEFMSELEEMKHMSEVPDLEKVSYVEGYFMPHHSVIKEDSLTTKCRVVFDSSAKTSSGLSLNDVQRVGPNLQQDVFSILVRFRRYKYVMTGDVSKMFRQILVNDKYRKYQRIIWRPDPLEILKIFEINRLVFGNASSPYIAVRCLFQLAFENEEKYPEACERIKNDMYMDDLLTGSDSSNELLSMQRDISSILASAGFTLRKWLTNDHGLLKRFEVTKEIEISIVNIGENEQNKTLGVYWNSSQDLFQYKISDFDNSQGRVTKRRILSTTCQIFDPLGLLGPIIIVAKLIIQDLWKLKLDWDEDVPPNLRQKWLNFQTELPEINRIEVPRRVVFTESMQIEVHGFCDASEKAYGACIYLRCVFNSGRIISNLVCGKSRVAPIKQVSLPRLELCSALLLANLAKRVVSDMKIQHLKQYYWSDSMIALGWIRNPSKRWKTFVANRVSEIQTLTNIESWSHVKSEENPADLLSRGVSIIYLIDCELWWHGPKWLEQDTSSWNSSVKIDVNDLPEEKLVTCMTIIKRDNIIMNLILKCSSLQKLQRVTAYVLRFISNLRTKEKTLRNFENLTPRELDNSLNILIKTIQVHVYPREYEELQKQGSVSKRSVLLPLNPFIKNNLIRVGGRLRYSNLPFDKKFPVILPKSNHLTTLILEHEHKRLLHCGVQSLLCSIRERYWPISGRNSCKKVKNSCVTCFKANPTVGTYLMGDLPDVRVNSYSPFIHTGVDYGGPFIIKDRKTRGAKLLKAYVCLFICMSTRAVHLELVSELTTAAFLSCLQRFVSRRGKPSKIFSDNGLNFVGANNELSKISDFLKENETVIVNHLANDGISWRFIPPRSPHFGGIWEAGIKSTKHHIKRLLKHPLTYEDFYTLLVRIEGILNSRPLCPISQDPDDLSALTPAHFLVGKPLTALPEFNVTDVPESRLDRWQHIQAISQHFWSRWSKEYLGELQTRTKWRTQSQMHLALGALVIIKDENAPSMSWQMGRITKLHPGKDNVVRVVDIKVPNGEITRAVNKICILPIN